MRRWNGPLMLAVAGIVVWYARPGSLATGLVLLFCPGWGLTRLLTGIERAFGVLGSSLCLSLLALGLVPLLGGVPADKLGLTAHILSMGLCLLGGMARSRRDRNRPADAQLPARWPARTPTCLVLMALALSASLWASPLDAPAEGSARVVAAARAQAWQTGGEDPYLAGVPMPRAQLLPAAAAMLASASGLHPLQTVALATLAALLASLMFVAEGVSRLWGNRGGARAMLALLLGLNPLAVLFMLGAQDAEQAVAAMSPNFDPNITAALSPFLDGSPLALALGFTAMLLACTLAVVRRASVDVPRLAGLASLGLVLSLPEAGALLLPGWLVGIGWAHLACRDSPDNDPVAANPARLPGEPRRLRAPFWRLALPIGLLGLLGFSMGGAPPFTLDHSPVAAWGLLAAVGPACLLFLPGVRHLNDSPGREAFFFAGLVLVTATLGVATGLAGDPGNRTVRLLSLVLAVPCAVGAIKMVDIHGSRARLILLGLVATLLPASGALTLAHAHRPRMLQLDTDRQVSVAGIEPGTLALLQTLRDTARPDAAWIATGTLDTAAQVRAALVTRRPLLCVPRPDPGLISSRAGLEETAERAALLEKLPLGLGGPLMALRGRSGLAQREFWALHPDPEWPGFQTVARSGQLLLSRSSVPDVVLVTVSCLRDDRLVEAYMPELHAETKQGVRFQHAISPLPDTVPGLLTLLSGLTPGQHQLRSARDMAPPGLPTLDRALAQRGYRTSAVVALDRDWLRDFLPTHFAQVHAEADADAATLVDVALTQLAAADPRPLFLWLHLSDLVLPYAPPASVLDESTGQLPFPVDPNLDATHYGVAAFPPAPLRGQDARYVDVPRGMAQYDRLVGLLDRALGRLARSVPDEDLLVVTAPHGTSLNEHEAWFDAGRDLFEPSIHVPLVLAGAGLRSRHEAGLTSLADLPDLLLHGRRLYADRSSILLESRQRKGLGTGRAYPPGLDPTSRGQARRLWGLRRLHGKILLTHEPGAALPALGLAYDLDRDPDEMQPVPADGSDLALILRQRIPAQE